MMAHARGDARRQSLGIIRVADPSGDVMPIFGEASVADGDDAKVVPLDRIRLESPTRAPGIPASPPDDSSPPPPPAKREETLAERLDHALDDIRRLMIADRTKGPY